MSKNIIVTIDGPAGSGKSTSAKLISEKLGFLYLDTGAMYRAVTYLAIKNNVIEDKESIISIAKKVDIKFLPANGKNHIQVDGQDVTEAIRSFEVNSRVSEVSKIPSVRAALVKIQQKIGANENVVAEGRDTGTVVFPNAQLKVFLIAGVEVRAKRRQKDFVKQGEEISLTEIEENIKKRDYIDSNRDVSPLLKADGAFEIDTSNITIEEQVNLILEQIKDIMQ